MLYAVWLVKFKEGEIRDKVEGWVSAKVNEREAGEEGGFRRDF